MVVCISTTDAEFIRLALWLGTVTSVNLFWIVLHVLGYEITNGPRHK